MVTPDEVTLDEFFDSKDIPFVEFELYDLFQKKKIKADREMMGFLLEVLQEAEITAFYECTNGNKIYLNSVLGSEYIKEFFRRDFFRD